MLRMGRKEEAVNTMDLVLSSHPGDQATLQACTMYFKETSDCKFVLTLVQCYTSHFHVGVCVWLLVCS